MKAVELFAGVGGFRIGLERAGHEVIWANEWDKYACDTYDKNFGGECENCRLARNRQEDIRIPERQEALDSSGADIPQGERPDRRTLDSARSEDNIRSCPHAHTIDRRDLTTIPATDIPAHDLIVGGFPCQAFSIAGKRRGFEETRGTLFFEIMRIAQHHRTPYLFLENVKGLLNHDKGRTFETILGTLDELGYDCQWQVLNSKNFGVPQNRERVIIIGHLRSEPRPEVFPLGDYDGEVVELPGQHSNTLTTRYEGGQATGTYVIESELNAQEPVANTVTTGTTHTVGNYVIEQLNDPIHSNDRVYGVGGISPTLNTMQGGNRQPFVAEPMIRTENMNGDGFMNPYAGTLRAGASKNNNLVFDNMPASRIRRLTPMECERLQGFPDGWTEGVSDSQRYKQMGNAVTTNVIEAVARRLPLVR